MFTQSVKDRLRTLKQASKKAAPFPKALPLTGLLLLAGCVNPVEQPNELVVREDLETFCSDKNRPTESFELVTHRDWQRGVVMLYEGVCGPTESADANSPLYVKGYKVFEREGLQCLLRDSGEDARFAIFAVGAEQLCELRVLDDDDQVLFRDHVSDTCESAARPEG